MWTKLADAKFRASVLTSSIMWPKELKQGRAELRSLVIVSELPSNTTSLKPSSEVRTTADLQAKASTSSTVIERVPGVPHVPHQLHLWPRHPPLLDKSQWTKLHHNLLWAENFEVETNVWLLKVWARPGGSLGQIRTHEAAHTSWYNLLKGNEVDSNLSWFLLFHILHVRDILAH